MAILDVLPREERVPLQLRALYESRGYRKYRMGKFEPYDVYRENSSFLNNARIITFTNANGRLMALKPDVTISIVKNTSVDTVSQKLYYLENVFRMERGTREYSEIRQMGIEFIGGDAGYAEAEVVSLALESLGAIGDEFILNISHMGYLSALLDGMALSGEQRGAVLRAIRQKNPAGIRAAADAAGLDENACKALCAVSVISGPPETALAEMRRLVRGDDMASAVRELAVLVGAVAGSPGAERLRIDLSVVNDMDYYNGLVFQGFLRGAPGAVLAGGRYDNMMRRFQKPQPAIGFALYLSELDRMLRTVRAYDADTLLLYGEAEPAAVMKAVRELLGAGESVRAEQTAPPELHARRICRLTPDGLIEEVEQHA